MAKTIEEIKKMDNVSVKDAAEFLGTSQGFIRQALKDQRLPIGAAVQQSPTKWTFNISPGLLIEYKNGRYLKNYFDENKEILRTILED